MYARFGLRARLTFTINHRLCRLKALYSLDMGVKNGTPVIAPFSMSLFGKTEPTPLSSFNAPEVAARIAHHALLESIRKSETTDEVQVRSAIAEIMPSWLSILDSRLSRGGSIQQAADAVQDARLRRALQTFRRFARMSAPVAVVSPVCKELEWAEHLPSAELIRIDSQLPGFVSLADFSRVSKAGGFVSAGWRSRDGLQVPRAFLRILETRFAARGAAPEVLVKSSPDCLGIADLEIMPSEFGVCDF